MRIVNGSRTKNTYCELVEENRHVASIWGMITDMKPDWRQNKLFVCINETDAFIHDVDKVILDEMGSRLGIQFVVERVGQRD